MALWAHAKRDWLCRWLTLEQGEPSHDTFARVLGMIDPSAFENAFISWVQSIVPHLAQGSVAAPDSKSSRATCSKDQGTLHIVSAFVAGRGLVLGQRMTDDKSNEITAIPTLLDSLALEGCIVSMDAMGT